MKMKSLILTIASTVGMTALSIAQGQSICTNDTFVSIANLPSVLNDTRAVYYNNDFYIFGGMKKEDTGYNLRTK